jgi:tyrosyl-tRNA synthetase
MYQNKATIDATAGVNGGSGFASAYYWSSTETNNYYAWYQSFVNGSQDDTNKLYTFRVRAVRAF